ncbi:hypothetical protein ACIQXI_04820 [Lysinibacillus sp. NPDC097195]|uniref:hypothetical protein n=1 Tax=Lysinibacillus sp. NPDC097195 TaxID=3364141 RepID=UPI00382D6829
MKHSLVLFISICLMQICILTNITLLKGEWDGITLWLCTAIFIFASTIFGFSRKDAAKK